MLISMLAPSILEHHFIMHQEVVSINASSFFLIEMPTSMPVLLILKRHFIMHQAVVSIGPSSFFLIDVPISMLASSILEILHFIVHH